MEFAKEIWRALETGIPGLFEAGTGTGKSLAALIPAALSGKKVVVSTATISLQEQYIHKDIPCLQSVLPFSIQAALVKGRSNYVSLRRFDDHRLEAEIDPRLFAWLESTETGDRSELDFAPLPETWMEIDSDPDDCLRNKCPRFADCYYFQSRREAEKADILVVNHALLLIDAASGGNVLPPYEVLIVDEAHQLPEIATRSFSLSLGMRGIQYLTGRASKQLSAPGHLVHSVEELAEEFFEKINASLPIGKTRIRQSPPRSEELSQSLLELRDWLVCADFINVLDIDDKREKLKLKAKALAGVCGTYIQCLDLLQSQDRDWVYWVEKPEPFSRKIEVVAAPLRVAEMLEDMIFNKPGLESSIWMSATLATGGEDPFLFFKQQVGAPQRVIQSRFASPFDFKRQAALYLPSGMPDPNSRDYSGACATEIERILHFSRGRAFVLFTSYSAMNRAYETLSPRLPFECRKQGDMSRKKLVDWFKDTSHAVLFATSSFWEGVSIDGEQLSCVIIDRIPFQAPDDPVYEARCELLKQSDEGENWFSSLALPHAIMRLKQGVGRLIRTRSDRGVVAILDPRLTGKSYGRTVISCLPPMTVLKNLDKAGSFDELWDGHMAVK